MFIYRQILKLQIAICKLQFATIDCHHPLNVQLQAVKAGQTLETCRPDIGLASSEIGGAAVVCPNLDSNRSLSYLVKDPWGRHLERTVALQLKKLAMQIHAHHPAEIDAEAIERANSICQFDRELVIERLGFGSVEEYYQASSPLHLLPHLQKPTPILYADDPMFDPTICPTCKLPVQAIGRSSWC